MTNTILILILSSVLLVTVTHFFCRTHLVSNRTRCELGYGGEWQADSGMSGKGICVYKSSILTFGDQITGRILFEGDEDPS